MASGSVDHGRHEAAPYLIFVTICNGSDVLPEPAYFYKLRVFRSAVYNADGLMQNGEKIQSEHLK